MPQSEVEDRYEIEQILVRYAQACDTRDMSLLQTIFIKDATTDYGGEHKYSSRQDINDLIMRMLGGCGPTQHVVTNFRIDVDGDTAKSTCYIRADHIGAGKMAGIRYECWGEYIDDLVRTPAGWRIKHRTMNTRHATGDFNILRPAEALANE